jgi:hypothetical protein
MLQLHNNTYTQKISIFLFQVPPMVEGHYALYLMGAGLYLDIPKLPQFELLISIILLWHSQKGFECEDKSQQLNHIQKKEHHLVTCAGRIRKIMCNAKNKGKGIC